MRTIWICRHGHREDFVERAPDAPAWRETAARPDDPGLSELGFRQARLLGERLRQESISHIFASPFLRTVQTAHAVAEALGLPVKVEPGISELLKSEWFPASPKLYSPAELHQQYPQVDTAYRPRSKAQWPEEDEQRNAWPRVRRAMEAILPEFDGSLLFVGHGSSCAGIVDALTGSGHDFPNPAAPCSITTLQTPGHGRTLNNHTWTFQHRACELHLVSFLRRHH